MCFPRPIQRTAGLGLVLSPACPDAEKKTVTDEAVLSLLPFSARLADVPQHADPPGTVPGGCLKSGGARGAVSFAAGGGGRGPLPPAGIPPPRSSREPRRAVGACRPAGWGLAFPRGSTEGGRDGGGGAAAAAARRPGCAVTAVTSRGRRRGRAARGGSGAGGRFVRAPGRRRRGRGRGGAGLRRRPGPRAPPRCVRGDVDPAPVLEASWRGAARCGAGPGAGT